MSNQRSSGSFFTRSSAKLLSSIVKTEVFGDIADVLLAANKNPNVAICYVLQFESQTDLLLVHEHTARLKMQASNAALTLGSELHEKNSVVFLHPSSGIVDIFADKAFEHNEKLSRLVHFVHMHGDADYDVLMVPVTVLWGRSPDKEDSVIKLLFDDSWQPPTVFKQLVNVGINGRENSLHIHHPISLKQLIQQYAHDDLAIVTEQIALHLHDQLVLQRELTIGPDLSDRRNIVKSLLQTDGVRKAIQQEANQKQLPVETVRQQAMGYVNEIASDYNYSTVKLFKRTLSWLWTQLYDGVEVHNFEPIRRLAEDYQLIYTPSHRSHIDYLLLSYIIYFRGLMIPYIAAGDNLNLPVLGGILRGGGAFFLRRSFKGNHLYTTVFKEYLNSILVRNTPIEYFIEGGRSRTGRLMPPKMGMLAWTVHSYLRREGTKPIAFIPTYVGYERLMEGSTYVGEMQGKPKESESILGLLKSLRKIERIFGKVHVNFGEPVFLDPILKAYGLEHTVLMETDDPLPEVAHQSAAQVAPTIQQNINRAAVINPVSLLSLVLLSTPKHALDEDICIKQLETYKKLAEHETYDEHVEVTPLSAVEIIEYGIRLKLIERVPHVLGNMIRIAANQAVLLTYFRNNIQHIFIISSLIAALVQHNGKMHLSQIQNVIEGLYPFLQSELFLKWRAEVVHDVVKREVDLLIDLHIIENDGRHNLFSPQPNTQAFNQLSVMSAPVKQSLQRYFMTMLLISRQGSGKITTKQLESLSHLLGQRLSVLYEFNSPEFFDKALFKSFIDELKNKEYIRTNEQQLIEFDEQFELIAQQADLVLDLETLQTLEQMTDVSEEEIEAALVALEKQQTKRFKK